MINENTQSAVGLEHYINERKQLEDAQLFLLQCAWSASGEDFFRLLARYLAESLSMDFICIDRLSGDLLSAQTEAVFHNGAFEDNVNYTLKQTPCGDVVGKTICSFQRDVRHLFPQDYVLQEMAAEGYVGTTLWSSQGKPIGLIAMISRKPIANLSLAESVLKLVSIRAAGELERKLAEEALQTEKANIDAIFESSPIGMLILDEDMNIVRVNYAAMSLVRWDPSDMLYKQPGDVLGCINSINDSQGCGKSAQCAFCPLRCGMSGMIETNSALRGVEMPMEIAVNGKNKTIWLRINAESLVIEGKRHINVAIDDITDHKQVEETLLLSAERNRHIADVLQNTIIPSKVPVQPVGYNIAARYKPALSEAEVCGDFYDIIDMGDGKLGIVIPSVSSKSKSPS